MPKLPIPATKARRPAATRCGRSSGSTTPRTIAAGIAPSTRAASTSEAGMRRSPAIKTTKASGAWCSPRTSTMPLRPTSGFGLPGAGARPRVLRMGEPGPARLRKASATTCGDTSVESTKAREATRRRRRSVAPRRKAMTAPRRRARRAEREAVSSC